MFTLLKLSLFLMVTVDEVVINPEHVEFLFPLATLQFIFTYFMVVEISLQYSRLSEL